MKPIPVLSNQRLKELLDKEAKLASLEQGGVDNWEFYDIALDKYRKHKELEELKKEFMQDLLETISGHIEEPAGRGCGYGLREKGYNEPEAFLQNYNIIKL